MLAKKRVKPIIILQLEALLRRLPANHSKVPEIEKELAKRRAGFRGEQSVDYYLSLLNEEKFDIFQDIRLPRDQHFFQMDSFLVSPNFLAIIEVKNISGTIHFDSVFSQLIRTIDGKEEGFHNPFSQLQHQKNQLSDWLLDNKFPLLPIETLVVISNPSTIIKIVNGSSALKHKISHASNLHEKIQRFEEFYKNPFINAAQRKKLKRLLLKNHTERKTDLLQRMQISSESILTGVRCESSSLMK
ncbi:nuclease-related domain-containing protein [Metabacillus sp. RGM 3146]|uniref:nuclease-related domain-containing protein n=1 Tax=Metabacillus sp. RGM 3146 TaxID=3401092 RepID=UPI003B9D9BA0